MGIDKTVVMENMPNAQEIIEGVRYLPHSHLDHAIQALGLDSCHFPYLLNYICKGGFVSLSQIYTIIFA